jgi:hypothetical protein
VSEQNPTVAVTPLLRTRRVTGEAETLRRRLRNREKMREKRADPAYRAFEKKRRDERYGVPVAAVALEIVRGDPSQAPQLRGRCAICRKRAAVEVITRLRPSADSKAGYVQMRVAYCGFC